MEQQSSVSETKICRVCASSMSFLHSIDSMFEDISYAVILQVMCPVKIERKDSLPKYICFDCVDIILRAYKLRDICMNNDRKFRSLSKSCNVPLESVFVKSEFPNDNREDNNMENTVIEIEKGDNTTTANRPENTTEQTESRGVSCKRRGESRLLRQPKKTRKEGNNIGESNDDSNNNNTHQPNYSETKEISSIYKCDIDNCAASYNDSNLLKIHKAFEHYRILYRPSQHELFDVEINKKSRSIQNAFGSLRSLQEKNDDKIEIDPKYVFCKLCINEGKIGIFNKELSELEFSKHICQNHLNIQEQEEERIPVQNKKSRPRKVVDETPLDIKFKYITTRSGTLKVVAGGFNFYQIKNLSTSDVNVYTCGYLHKGKRCKSRITISKKTNTIIKFGAHNHK